MEPQTKNAAKKKKTRFFETYIVKLLKQISDKKGITTNAKQQLNAILCTVARLISKTSADMTIFAKKKTMSDGDVLVAAKALFSGELMEKIVDDARESVIAYRSNPKGKKSETVNRQDRAGIIFPPSIAEKFLRNFGHSSIMVTNTAPVCLAAILEIFTRDILSNAQEIDSKKVRITVRDLELSVRGDQDSNAFFNRHRLTFLGGGCTPFIHDSLKVKKIKKKTSATVKNSGVKKPHRFRPGTVALREIRRYQKNSNRLVFAKFPFEKIFRQCIEKNISDKPTSKGMVKEFSMKISKEVFTVIQYFTEMRMAALLRDANFLAIHAGRVKLLPIDIRLADAMRSDKPNPYMFQGIHNQMSQDAADEEEYHIDDVAHEVEDFEEEEEEEFEEED